MEISNLTAIPCHFIKNIHVFFLFLHFEAINKNTLTGQSLTIRSGRRRKKLPIAPPVWNVTQRLRPKQDNIWGATACQKTYTNNDLLCKDTSFRVKTTRKKNTKKHADFGEFLGGIMLHMVLAWFSAKEWKSCSTVLPCCCSNCLGAVASMDFVLEESSGNSGGQNKMLFFG